MPAFQRIKSALRNLFRRESVERDLDAEVTGFAQLLEEQNVREGMTFETARRKARIEMGGPEQLKEEVRGARAGAWLEAIWQDLRYAVRVLRKNPGFTAVAILTLALGVGANAAIFSVVDTVLLRPLSLPEPERLVSLTDAYPEGAFVALRDNLHTMEVAAYRDGEGLNLTGRGEPVRLLGTAVSANFFAVLNVRPELGRIFLAGEDQPGKSNVIILSHALWQQQFSADPNIIGHTVMLEGQSREIVGVMPPGFRLAAANPEFWVPLSLNPRAIGDYWGTGFMPVIGRLKPGASIRQAGSEALALLPQVRTMFPWRMPDALWASASVVPLQENLIGPVRTKLWLLLGAVALVLLIGCANVANLMLARAAVRVKEMALRAALGAGSSRLFRQLLTESAVLAFLGALLGLLFAKAGVAWLKTILPTDTPRLSDVSMDWRVIAFTAAAAILSALVFGLLPALQSSRADLIAGLKTAGQSTTSVGGNRVRNSLAIGEIALAVMLVTGAGLIVKSLWQLSKVQPGFRRDSVLTARLTPSQPFCADALRCGDFYRDLLDRVRALPGVTNAAVVNILPLTGQVDGFAAALEDHPSDPREPAPMLMESVVSPDYFATLGVPLLRGRLFTAADSAVGSAPIALISAATAQEFWPGQDPIGKHLKPVFDQAWITVVGVVGDVNEYSLAARLPDFAAGAIYTPYGNGAHASGRHGRSQPVEMTLVARTSNDPTALATALRQTVATLNNDAPVTSIRTLETVVSQSLASPRSTMALFAIFAALALVLGAIGVYGVISYGVAQRRPEFGIRMACGAQPSDVLLMVLSQGLRLTSLGILLGVAGALAVTRLLASFLFAVSPADPLTYSAVVFLLGAVALAASYIPARRAMRVDPMIALRHE